MTTTTHVSKELSVPYFRHVLARAGFTVIDGSILTAGYQFRIERAGCVVGWGYTGRAGVTINATKFDCGEKFHCVEKFAGAEGIRFNC